MSETAAGRGAAARGPSRGGAQGPWLLAATFAVAVSGLVYELIAGAAASYLLGDSVAQFSLVIGLFMSAMGLGAYLSRYVEDAERGFALSQIALGLVGGFSAPALFLAYGWLSTFEPLLVGLVVAIGALSGLEIPLVTRLLEREGALRTTLSSVLTADYAGALAAALAFPVLIVPHLGLTSASLVFGAMNLAVAGLSLWLFRRSLGWGTRALWAGALAACLTGFVFSERLVSAADAGLYEDEVILSEETPYQRIVVTRSAARTRLFLDGAIQFDTLDEHRYHEALVHPAMGLAPRRARVLILGGGDGMAAREALRWRDVEEVVLVDLDPRVTGLFRTRDDLAALNGRSLSDPRVRVINADAWTWLEDAATGRNARTAFVAPDGAPFDRAPDGAPFDRVPEVAPFDVASGEVPFDVAILDLPDPSSLEVSKLYSRAFYRRLVRVMSANGVIVAQAGSPLFARRAFWSIVRTLGETANPARPDARLGATAYHAYVPSFGDWGFALAGLGAMRETPATPPGGLRFYAPALWPAMTRFPADTGPVEAEANTLHTHALVGYYEEGWAHWFR
ncbi:MAG: spermidine synthase [Paracoccaceae bacterium]